MSGSNGTRIAAHTSLPFMEEQSGKILICHATKRLQMALQVYFDAAQLHTGALDLTLARFGLAVAIFEGNRPCDVRPYRGEISMESSLRGARYEALKLAMRRTRAFCNTYMMKEPSPQVIFRTTDRRLVEEVKGIRIPKDDKDRMRVEEICTSMGEHRGTWKISLTGHTPRMRAVHRTAGSVFESV